jgi:hypothetical protein
MRALYLTTAIDASTVVDEAISQTHNTSQQDGVLETAKPQVIETPNLESDVLGLHELYEPPGLECYGLKIRITT